MASVDVYSWFFVHKAWRELQKTPKPDKGFEESFRAYLYGKISFDRMSDVRDRGFGLSYTSLSSVAHELDVICCKGRDLYVFELKHFEATDISKEIVFTFLGKVIDFYFKNAQELANYKITMYLVTINVNVDDAIRKLCTTFGIRLIEPSLMTIETLEHFTNDLYQKLPAEMSDTRPEVEDLLENIAFLKQNSEYTFSDVFAYRDGKIEVELESLISDANDTLNKVKQYYALFEKVKKIWRPNKN